MGELCFLLNFYLNFTNLYPTTPPSALHLELNSCLRQCVESRSCLSVFYDKTEKECLLMKVLVQESDPNLVGKAGALYYGLSKEYLQNECRKHPGYSLEGDGYCLRRMAGQSYSWNDARDACQSDGGDLLKVDTSVKNFYLMEVVSSLGYLWLGGSDKGVEGQWKWTDGTLVAAFTDESQVAASDRWAPTEPNGGTSENCLGMWTEGWGSVECTLIGNFICEKRLFR